MDEVTEISSYDSMKAIILFACRKETAEKGLSAPHTDQLHTGCFQAALGPRAHGQTTILKYK